MKYIKYILALSALVISALGDDFTNVVYTVCRQGSKLGWGCASAQDRSPVAVANTCQQYGLTPEQCTLLAQYWWDITPDTVNRGNTAKYPLTSNLTFAQAGINSDDDYGTVLSAIRQQYATCIKAGRADQDCRAFVGCVVASALGTDITTKTKNITEYSASTCTLPDLASDTFKTRVKNICTGSKPTINCDTLANTIPNICINNQLTSAQCLQAVQYAWDTSPATQADADVLRTQLTPTVLLSQTGINTLANYTPISSLLLPKYIACIRSGRTDQDCRSLIGCLLVNNLNNQSAQISALTNTAVTTCSPQPTQNTSVFTNNVYTVCTKGSKFGWGCASAQDRSPVAVANTCQQYGLTQEQCTLLAQYWWDITPDTGNRGDTTKYVLNPGISPAISFAQVGVNNDADYGTILSSVLQQYATCIKLGGTDTNCRTFTACVVANATATDINTKKAQVASYASSTCQVSAPIKQVQHVDTFADKVYALCSTGSKTGWQCANSIDISPVAVAAECQKYALTIDQCSTLAKYWWDITPASEDRGNTTKYVLNPGSSPTASFADAGIKSDDDYTTILPTIRQKYVSCIKNGKTDKECRDFVGCVTQTATGTSITDKANSIVAMTTCAASPAPKPAENKPADKKLEPQQKQEPPVSQKTGLPKTGAALVRNQAKINLQEAQKELETAQRGGDKTRIAAAQKETEKAKAAHDEARVAAGQERGRPAR